MKEIEFKFYDVPLNTEVNLTTVKEKQFLTGHTAIVVIYGSKKYLASFYLREAESKFAVMYWSLVILEILRDINNGVLLPRNRNKEL